MYENEPSRLYSKNIHSRKLEIIKNYSKKK